MALTQVNGGLIESGAALSNIGAGNITPTYLSTQSQYTGFKNRIINGAMGIDQRNVGASVTVTSNPVYGADRFNSSKTTSSGTITVQQSSTVPAGFNKSLLHTVSTGASPAAGDQNRIEHCVEGNNFADFDFGASNAQSFTFSFWVRSSVTGTYAVAFLNATWTRSYVATYTVNSSNTWEQKTITVSGDTTGTWAKDNTVGIRLKFDLGSGSTYNTATPNQWVSGEYYRTSSTVTLLATTGATFYITGVQLEKGSTATSFDYRPYGTELQLCQRYFEKSFDTDTAPANGANSTSILTENGVFAGISNNNSGTAATIKFAVSKRATPTITYYGNSSGYWRYIRSSATSSYVYNVANNNVEKVGTLSFCAGQYVIGNEWIAISGHWTSSAEL